MGNLQECGICAKFHIDDDSGATYPQPFVDDVLIKHRNAVSNGEKVYTQTELDKLIAKIESQ